MKKGKLVVFEGIDGSGKSVNYKKLCENLAKDNIEYYNIVFPRYDKESSALIRMYLNGEMGSKPDDVNAYAASIFYTVDRFASYKNDWGELYDNGKLIISDRYTTSNAVHQGAKLNDSELTAYYDWLEDIEFNKMGLPKPDLVIYLESELELSLSRMKKRQETTNTKADIHEKDIEYLNKCLKTAEKACSYYNWVKIPCRDSDGNEISLEHKYDMIYKLVKDIL